MTSSFPPPPVPAFPPAPSLAMAPTGARNTLSLVSFLVALYIPVEALLIVLAVLTHAQTLLILVSGLGVLALPATVTAVVTGHLALARAKHYAPGHALRGFAIAGLVIGYLAAAGVVLTLAAFIIGSILQS